MNFLYLDHWQPETDNPRGRFQFATNATARSGAQAGNFYNQYAAFLLGLVGTASKSVQAELMTGREWQHGLYIRDRWTVSPKITLDLGVRWEYYPIMHRADRGIEILDLQTLDVMLGGRGGNPNNVGLKASKDNFAPRLGLVYRMNEQTVIRTGYGVTYNPLPWSRPLRGDSSYPVTIASHVHQQQLRSLRQRGRWHSDDRGRRQRSRASRVRAADEDAGARQHRSRHHPVVEPRDRTETSARHLGRPASVVTVVGGTEVVLDGGTVVAVVTVVATTGSASGIVAASLGPSLLQPAEPSSATRPAATRRRPAPGTVFSSGPPGSRPSGPVWRCARPRTST